MISAPVNNEVGGNPGSAEAVGVSPRLGGQKVAFAGALGARGFRGPQASETGWRLGMRRCFPKACDRRLGVSVVEVNRRGRGTVG